MERSLKAGFEYRGCILCYVLDKDETDFMVHLQYQIAKEEKIRQDLVSSSGFCNFHFYQMARLTSPKVIAVLTKELVERETREIKNGSLGSVEETDCAVCQYVKKREEFYLEELRVFLPDKSFQNEYESTDGLCRVHLKRVLDLLNENDLRRFLLTTQTMQLKLLRMELETFISKVRSTFRDMGAEKNSWSVAVQKWVGKMGLS
jgi:hypothetical protein